MAGRFLSTLFLLFLIASIPPIYGSLITNDIKPGLIDQFLQLVWEPSSLIRLWVGLDQVLTIARSWGGVAKKLASLPFGGESQEHITIQEPRSMMYHKPSVGSQLDRFNQMYSSSNLSPIVANARKRLFYNQRSLGNAMSSNVHPAKTEPMSGLPPLAVFQPQEVFLNSNLMRLYQSLNGQGQSLLLDGLDGFKQSGTTHNLAQFAPLQNLNAIGHFMPFQNMNDLRHSTPFQNVNHLGLSGPFENRVAADSARSAKLMALQKQRNRNVFSKQISAIPFRGAQRPPANPKRVNDNSELNITPQERLNMFLILMKTLGKMQTHKIASIEKGKFPPMHRNLETLMDRQDAASMHANKFESRDILETDAK